jgi:hypothetical protein
MHLLNIRQGAEWLHARREHTMQRRPPCRTGVQQQGQAADVTCEHECKHTVAPSACPSVVQLIPITMPSCACPPDDIAPTQLEITAVRARCVYRRQSWCGQAPRVLHDSVLCQPLKNSSAAARSGKC